MIKQALKQASDIARVENVASLAVRKVLTRFKLVAIKRTGRGDASFITQKEIDELVRIVASTMASADGLARRRVRSQVRAIKLSLFDEFSDITGQFYSNALQVVTGYTQKVNDELNKFTQELIAENLPVEEMKRKLAKKFESLGVDPKNSYALENIVRTQAQIHYNAAKLDEESSDDIQEILWGYKYVTVGDSRVRPEHAALEGTTLPKDDPFWERYYPPNGWSCRCQAVPIFDKEKIKRPKELPEIDPSFAFPPNVLRGTV